MNYTQVTNKKDLYIQIQEELKLNMEIDEFELLFFKRKDNIRLTYQGCRILNTVFESYKFEHNDIFLAKHLIAISREFQLPYFLSKHQLIVFSAHDATMITLCGDIKTFLERLTVTS